MDADDVSRDVAENIVLVLVECVEAVERQVSVVNLYCDMFGPTWSGRVKK